MADIPPAYWASTNKKSCHSRSGDGSLNYQLLRKHHNNSPSSYADEYPKDLTPAMTTLQPRPPYSAEELKVLYPEGLELQLVQVLLRHGERSPVSARFQNAGLNAFVYMHLQPLPESCATSCVAMPPLMQIRRSYANAIPSSGPIVQ